MLPCRCCGHLTIEEYNEFEICPVCYWEDDLLQSRVPDYIGGTNRVSLIQAKKNYADFGACDEHCLPHVREPFPEEIPMT